ncbi:MAG: aldehyde dehydrogenase, partial [Flavobacterium psychrophilum]
MKAQEALDYLDPIGWANTDIFTRLAILEQMRANMKTYAKELGYVNSKMKNELVGAESYSVADGMMQSIGPVASSITASIEVYEALAKGEMLKPVSVNQVDADRYDVEVFPIFPKDKLTAGRQKGFIRVKGQPKQINPMEKAPGIVAVSGAGNYTSSLESIKALFYDNKVVMHKPHKLNEESDAIWEKIFAPLFEIKAMASVDANQSREMATLEGLSAIYFTGSTDVAKNIMQHAKTTVVSECGGNNPCIIVPGRTWTDKEVKHQAEQIVSMAKANGGAACGRPQTFVTSKNWPQRLQFLAAIRKAATEDTYAVATYYPGTDKTKENFLKNYPNAEILKPENGKHPKSDFV